MPNYNATLKMIDVMGRFTTQRIQVFGADADAAATNLAAIAILLQACTKLSVYAASLVVDVAAPGPAPMAGSNTDVGGKVKGFSAVDGKVVILRLPDPIAAIVNSTGGFDLEEENLADYLAAFETGGNARISDGEDVDYWGVGQLDAR